MRGPRICVIGAGAGGLSAAYYLAKRGYRNVRVLEHRDRVGGLCDSFTADGVAFDLGGNYVLPNYGYVRAIARDIGAQLTDGPSRITWDHTMNGGQGGYRSTLSGVLQGTNFFAFTWAAIRYSLLLFQYRGTMSPEGFVGVSKIPELCEPFSQFLTKSNLEPLRNLFVIPITIMGYAAPGVPGEYSGADRDYLDGVPACYVLKYVNFWTLLLLMAVGMGLPVPWPKRFLDGYQRFWEMVSWGLDVRVSAEVSRVQRGDVVEVTYRWKGEEIREEFDALIIGCPLPAALGFLDADDDERRLYGTIQTREYLIHIVDVEGLQNKIHDIMPITPFGNPWAVVKQWPQSNLCVTYSPVSPEITNEQAKDWARAQIEKMGGTVKQFHEWRRWRYFPHVTSDEIKAGVYDELEQLQGRRRTFIVGSVLGFELVERAVGYSYTRIEKYFPVIT